VRTEVFSGKSISVLSYSWTQHLAVRGHFILAIAGQNSLVETIPEIFNRESRGFLPFFLLPPLEGGSEREGDFSAKRFLGEKHF